MSFLGIKSVEKTEPQIVNGFAFILPVKRAIAITSYKPTSQD